VSFFDKLMRFSNFWNLAVIADEVTEINRRMEVAQAQPEQPP